MSIAVIGAGFWGKKVINEYLQLVKRVPLVDLSMVCDLEDENLRYCNEMFGIPGAKLSTDYKKALRSNDVGAVHICTPNETHFQICKEALTVGKHVLLEKPMALNARDAWELVGLAEHKGLVLQVGHIFRFNNAMKMIRNLIAKSYFGDLYYLKLQWTTLASFDRDIIYDLGPHPVDILNFILKKWPISVTCKARAYRREKLEELAYFTVEFEDRLMAHVELSWLQPGKIRRLDIIGSDRSATVDCVNQKVGVYENKNGDVSNLDVTKNNTILDEINHFATSARASHNSLNPGRVGARNVAVLESLKRSLEENRTIEMDLRDQE